MSDQLKALRAFLDSAHSFYHSTAKLSQELDEAGYTRLNESAVWDLIPGGKYYINRGGSSILAFRVPQSPLGFMISATHIDHPTFRLKVNGQLTGAYIRAAVEQYGGLILAPWLDRPLSIAGQAMVETAEGIQTRLVDIDRDLALIPNVAIHMNRSINDNTHLNVAVDMLPLLGCADSEAERRALQYLRGEVKQSVIKGKTVRPGSVELDVEVLLQDDDTDFVNALALLPGVDSAVLVSYSGEYMS